jgi:23S rRNA pseudouridine1911/1915/1917 synthase
MNIDILFEDNHILVVVKPPNMPVQEDESGDVDLLNVLKTDIKRRYKKTGNVFLGLVHRLDRPVSGVMVFAKTSKAASRLSEQIRERKLKKTYTAHVLGWLKEDAATLVHYLKKDSRSYSSHITNKEKRDFKKAELSYRIVDRYEETTEIEIDLKTGRHHQIRAQMSHIGHPIIGDIRYGYDEKRTTPVWHITKRGIALFATKLRFVHPTTKEELEFKFKPYPLNR